MDNTELSALPQSYKDAADYLQTTLRTRPVGDKVLGDLTVQASKGFDIDLWKSDANKDVVRLSVTSPELVNSAVADATSDTFLRTLHEIPAVRNEVILVPPTDYIEDVKHRQSALLGKAKEAGIPGADFDYTKSSVLDTNFSANQIQSFGTQLVEGANSTSIRANIPTNPLELEKAMETAKRVEADLNQRLPEIKEAMIQHIIRKNYIPGLTEAGIEQLRKHEFKVSVQQQANWTSVFIDIKSPEQQEAAAHPERKVEDPAALQKTNMLSQIANEQQRFKLAARSVLYTGEKLKTPSAIFNDVAGALDLKAAVGKVLYYLGKEKPELVPEIDALLKENVFERREQWNLPPDQQSEQKRRISGRIDPDHPTTMNFTFAVPKGKADEIMAAIAALNTQKSEATSATPTAEQAQAPAAEDGKLAVKAESTELGATKKIPAVDPVAAAKAQADFEKSFAEKAAASLAKNDAPVAAATR